ncbi:hypothetical protein ACT691_11490 [Vibrio metschnikovii]
MQALTFWQLTESQENALNDKYDESDIAQWAIANRIDGVNWQKQKMAPLFSQHQITDPQLCSRLRHVIHCYDVDLNGLNFQSKPHQTSENIVEQVRTLTV